MKTKLNLNMALRAALLAALTAVLAQLQLPIGPVPFNLAVLGAFLAGMLLRPAWAVCSMCVYMALGVIGIPVFAGFLGGPAVLVGKTGGYVLGYVCIAWCTAMARRFGRWWLTAAGMVLGLVLCAGHRVVYGDNGYLAGAEPCFLRMALCPAGRLQGGVRLCRGDGGGAAAFEGGGALSVCRK